MRKMLDRAFWWIGLKLLTLIGCLVFFNGAAQAKGQCKPGWKYRLVRDKDGGSTAGCTNGKTFDGYVQVRGPRNVLMMTGEFRAGDMDGVWKVYDGKGHVAKKVLFEHGKLVNEDYVPPEEMEGISAGWEGKQD